MKESNVLKDTPTKKNLIDHPSLIVLLPHMHSYCERGLTELLKGNKEICLSPIETYATGVWDRVAELDTALTSLRLAWQFVTDLGSEPIPSPEKYRYHYENFVLRVIGFVDRAHRLVGASLMLPSKKYEGMGGNAYVQKATKKSHLGLHDTLLAVAAAVNSYRGPRNELIHSNAYSSRELGLFMAIEQFSMDTGAVDINELKRDYSSAGATEISGTIDRLVAALTTLLDELGRVFATADEFCAAKIK